jgi:hypothetical protein
MTSARATGGAAPAPAPGGSRRAVFVISLICAAQFVLQLISAWSMWRCRRSSGGLGMAAAQLQWIVTGHALASGSLLLVGGRLADLLGRQVLAVGRAPQLAGR